MDRKEWIPAEEIRVGEHLETDRGSALVESVAMLPGAHRVYNLEVETDHCYFVGGAHVLVHNENPCAYTPPLAPKGPMTPDQRALKELVDETTLGGRKPLPVDQADTVLDWADEVGYPGIRAKPGDVGSPSNWPGGGNKPHIHVPGVGSGHIPVQPGVKPR